MFKIGDLVVSSTTDGTVDRSVYRIVGSSFLDGRTCYAIQFVGTGAKVTNKFLPNHSGYTTTYDAIPSEDMKLFTPKPKRNLPSWF